MFCVAVQEAVRKAQVELAKQKEVIMAQDKELKVKIFFFLNPHSFVLSRKNKVVSYSRSCLFQLIDHFYPIEWSR